MLVYIGEHIKDEFKIGIKYDRVIGYILGLVTYAGYMGITRDMIG